jgi:hypothetical protein
MQPIRSPFRLTGGGKIEIHDPVFLKERTAQRLARYTVKEGDVCLTIVGANVGEMGVLPMYSKPFSSAWLTTRFAAVIFTEYRRQKASASDGGGLRLPLCSLFAARCLSFNAPPAISLAVLRRVAR